MKPWLDDFTSLADAVRRGDVRAADVLEASLARNRRIEAERGVLPRRRRRAPAGRGDRPRGGGRSRSRADGRRAAPREGSRARSGDADDARLCRLPGQRRRPRLDRCEPRCGRRGGDRREGDGVRVRTRAIHGDEAARRHAQSVEPRTHAGRVIGRAGGGGRGRPGAGGDGERWRRLDPHTRALHRSSRAERDLGPGAARTEGAKRAIDVALGHGQPQRSRHRALVRGRVRVRCARSILAAARRRLGTRSRNA